MQIQNVRGALRILSFFATHEEHGAVWADFVWAPRRDPAAAAIAGRGTQIKTWQPRPPPSLPMHNTERPTVGRSDELSKMRVAKFSNGFPQGQVAATFLAKSGLPKNMLHQIWQLADHEEKGKLNLEAFYIALRLVGHAQCLGIVHPDLIHTVRGPRFLRSSVFYCTSQASPRHITNSSCLTNFAPRSRKRCRASKA